MVSGFEALVRGSIFGMYLHQGGNLPKSNRILSISRSLILSTLN